MATSSPSPEGGNILFIDAYDSFSENIAALLSQVLHVQVTMIHIDTRIEDLLDTIPIGKQGALASFLQKFDAVVLGPGPGNPQLPADVGLFAEIWRLEDEHVKPVLGICLGFQSLCVAFGASISRLPQPCHGHAKRIDHHADDIFAGMGEVMATNYNSLEARLNDVHSSSDTNILSSSSPYVRDSQVDATSQMRPDDYSTLKKLKPLAWDESGTLMAVRHVDLPYWGLQFHPESCRSSESCRQVIKNWWEASMLTSRNMETVNLNSTRLLSPGHAWSRPLTPMSSYDTPHGFSKDSRDAPTLLEELSTMTASSSHFVQNHTCRISASGRSIADLCRNLSPNDCTMLESTRKGRHSIYALPSSGRCRVEYESENSFCTVYGADQRQSRFKIVLSCFWDQIHRLMADKRAQGGHQSLPFWGGFIGFFSYEIGLEGIGVKPSYRGTCPDLPDINLLWVERCIVVDHADDKAYIQSLRTDDSIWITEMAHQLSSLSDPLNPEALSSKALQDLLESAQTTLPDEDRYKSKIQSCQSYLHSGDSYELCLTTEAEITMPSHPQNSWLLYQNLRRHNPVPFSAYISLGNTFVLSSSPEQFLTWDRSSGIINMVPMKGTVAKSSPMTAQRAKEILASPKESAENLMIADLIRHDLYSTVGWNASVEVIKLCEVVEHETVYQLVSHIRATPTIPKSLPSSSSSSPSPVSLSLSSSPSASSETSAGGTASIPVLSSPKCHHREIIRHGHKALRQTLPPGSMTGAPKKRSCEILDRLEERRRGLYSGVLGYLDVGGGGGFSVCIRTAVSHASEDYDHVDGDVHQDQKKNNNNNTRTKIEEARKSEEGEPESRSSSSSNSNTKRQKWRIGAGGAITVLSDLDAEWEEMKTKLESVLKAFRPDKR